jgi:hypothetical protein
MEKTANKTIPINCLVIFNASQLIGSSVVAAPRMTPIGAARWVETVRPQS